MTNVALSAAARPTITQPWRIGRGTFAINRGAFDPVQAIPWVAAWSTFGRRFRSDAWRYGDPLTNVQDETGGGLDLAPNAVGPTFAEDGGIPVMDTGGTAVLRTALVPGGIVTPPYTIFAVGRVHTLTAGAHIWIAGATAATNTVALGQFFGVSLFGFGTAVPIPALAPDAIFRQWNVQCGPTALGTDDVFSRGTDNAAGESFAAAAGNANLTQLAFGGYGNAASPNRFLLIFAGIFAGTLEDDVNPRTLTALWQYWANIIL